MISNLIPCRQDLCSSAWALLFWVLFELAQRSGGQLQEVAALRFLNLKLVVEVLYELLNFGVV